MINDAVIMAAGRGSRMAPLTDAIPKPMAPYDGSTLIGKGISRLLSSVKNIHITIGYKKAMLAPHVIEHGVSSVINTEGKPNSWWIYNSLLRYYDSPLLVLTCDNIIELDVESLSRDYEDLGRPACMLVPVKPVDGLEGDYIHHENQIVKRVDRNVPSEKYCSGIQVLNPARVVELTEEGDSFYDVWRNLIEAGELVVGRVEPAKWFSVDTLEHLMTANSLSLDDR